MAYKFSDPAHQTVTNLDTGYSGIGPASQMWEDYQEFLANGGVTQPYKTLAEYQDEMRLVIKAESLNRRYGGILVGTYWVPTDPDSRIEYLVLKELARDLYAAGAALDDPIIVDGDQVEVEAMNGTMIPATIRKVKLLMEALHILDRRLKRVAKYHISQMLLAPDPLKYDYSAGWPAAYQG